MTLLSADPVVPPHSFERIATGLFISTLPRKSSLAYLKRLGIQSIVQLGAKDALKLDIDAEIRSWLQGLKQNRWVHVEKVKGTGKVVLTLAAAKAAIEAILAAAPPILVTGYEGMESVALVIACIRKLQCWDSSSIQDELGRAIQLNLDAVHIRFINQFCSLTPLSVRPLICGVHDKQSPSASPPHNRTPTGIAHSATLLLPPLRRLPKWLWYGYRSPSALLYGGQYQQSVATLRELTWHPTMRIAYSDHHLVDDLHRALDGHLLLDTDYDALPTPRCSTSGNASPDKQDPLANLR